MKVAVVSIGSFDTQYSDYHIMRDIVLGLLERGHEVNLIQKQYLDTIYTLSLHDALPICIWIRHSIRSNLRST